MCTTSLNLVAWCVLAQALSAADRYRASEPHMGSLASITLYADTPGQAQKAFLAAFARISQINRILSDYDPASELSNACEGAPLSPDLRTIIDYAQQVAKETEGAFDITAGPLTQLWRNARKAKEPPSVAAIDEALNRSGHANLTVQRGQAQCATPGMQLDAGGIAKGYAADQAIAAIRGAGVRSALVALSGDIVVSGPPPGKTGWKIQTLTRTITLSNAAISTSGDEFQHLILDGVRYSHILDPRSGRPLQNTNPVAVIAQSGIEADSLATAISVGGLSLARKLTATRKIQVLTHDPSTASASPSQ